MKKIIFFISILFIFISCSNELITVVDEYNPPYGIKAIPGSNSISISFWSGILASDFVGFNLYAGTNSNFNQPNDAIKNNMGSYPTVENSTHTRSSFTFPISGTYNNGTLYYVSVTAYGTNDLAEGGKIETRIDSIIPVVPRQQQTGNGNFAITGTSTVAYTGGVIQFYGVQSNFDAITVFTNASSQSLSYAAGGLYIGSNGTTLSKLWINPSGGGNTTASHSLANRCNTI